MALIVHVYRPELVDDEEDNPFEGIEILGVVVDMAAANALIDKFQPDHSDWLFHIDDLPSQV